MELNAADSLGILLGSLGRGDPFDGKLYDSTVASNAVVVEEKKEFSGSGWKAKLEWMHNNGYTCEGYSSKPEDGQSFTFRCTFVHTQQGKKFGQSKFAFVRDGKILAIRRSEDAAKYVVAHPFLPTAQTASNFLREGTFGFLVVVKEAILRAPKDNGKPMKNYPALRPIPTPICVVSYEPGPVVLFDKKNKDHMEQLQKGWRLGTFVATRVAASSNPKWDEEGLVIVSKPAPFFEDIVNVEVFDQTDTGAVFLGSCHIPVNLICFPWQNDWNNFDNIPLWFGERKLESTISFAVKIQNAQFPMGDIKVLETQLTAAKSTELRNKDLVKFKPKFSRTTLEKKIQTTERIETATEILVTVGKVALEVTCFALKVAAHAH